jgi:hypothetical protein
MLAQEFESIQQGVYGLVMENLSRMDKQQLIADLPRFHTALSKLLAKSMEGLCGRIVRGKRSA